MIDLQMIRQDREALRQRWRREGFYRDISLSRAITEGAERYPDIENVFYTGRHPVAKTIGALYEEGVRIANALHHLGVRRGDVVAVQLPTRYEAAVIYQAIAHNGAVVIPIVHTYGENEVLHILQQSRARLLIVQDRWRNIDYLARLGAYRALPELRHAVVLGAQVPADAVGWEALLNLGNEPAPLAPSGPDEVCTVIYTSGTTSRSKGVQHSANTLLAELASPMYASEGVYLACLPAGHYGGYSFMLRAALAGVPTLFMDHWDADLAAAIVADHRVRESGGTPFFLLDLIAAAERGGHDLSSLKSFQMGGCGISPAQIEMTDAHGFPGGRVYGSTEHPTVSYSTKSMSLQERSTTDGRIDKGNEVRIVDDDGEDVPVGCEGEIITRGPELFLGYSDPNLDLDCFLPGGWFRTGDIGKLLDGGFIVVTGRKKDIIIRGGENISAREVEEILSTHPRIAEAAAIAMPDSKYGEKVCAFVSLNDSGGMDLQDIVAHFTGAGVARHKIPERLEVVAGFPRTASGKIRKELLKNQL